MGDRSYFQMIVTACPEEEQRAVLEAFDDYGIVLELDNDEPGLVLNQRYCIDEASLDMPWEINEALTEMAPRASYIAWSDPKYEYGGLMVMRDGETGEEWEGACDSNGIPYVTLHQFKTLTEGYSERDAYGQLLEIRGALGMGLYEKLMGPA